MRTPGAGCVLAMFLAAGAAEARSQPRGFPLSLVSVQLGVRLVETTEQLRRALGVEASQGALVLEVVPEEAAARAGIAAGDVLTRVAGEPVSDAAEVMDALQGHKPGEDVAVEYVRKGTAHTAQVKLAAARDRMRTGRWTFDVPGLGDARDRLHGEMRRFREDVDRRLRELERRLRRLEEDAEPERTAL